MAPVSAALPKKSSKNLRCNSVEDYDVEDEDDDAGGRKRTIRFGDEKEEDVETTQDDEDLEDDVPGKVIRGFFGVELLTIN